MAGRYRRVETVGIVLGLLELLFIPAAILAHPHGAALAHGLTHALVPRRPYLTMVAANVGAVIMPWMVFYQQQAVIDKGIRRRHLRMARIDTAMGSVLTQIVMIAIVVAAAATIGRAVPGASLSTIGEIVRASSPPSVTPMRRCSSALACSAPRWSPLWWSRSPWIVQEEAFRGP